MTATSFGSRVRSRSNASMSSRWSDVERNIGDLEPLLLGEEVPGDEVGVVFHDGEDDQVALAKLRRPQVWATRLIASVVLRTKMHSLGEAALMKAATRWRASSYLLVASSEIW